MTEMQNAVSNFNHQIGTPRLPRTQPPGLIDTELRARLIEEEAKETCDAIRRGDLAETIDGLCDLLYVAFGAADVFGVDLEPFFWEVHRSNMQKLLGEARWDAHGKRLKPDGWKPPRIAEMLRCCLEGDPDFKKMEQTTTVEI